MYVNHYKININSLSGTTSSINIPITMNYQLVDQNELVERVFVDVETEKAINPIIDYELVRYLPIDIKPNGNNIGIDRIHYQVNFLAGATYGDIGFTDDDIKFQKDFFKETFLNLNFYDNDNPLTQKLVTNITLFARITEDNLIPFGSPTGIVGQTNSALQIPLIFTLENPNYNKFGFSEGFHLYDYKDELNVGEYKYLFMRASFKNAKTGVSTNMMVQPNPLVIDELIHELYTRYKLIRTIDGYFYEIDDTYHGNTTIPSPNNVIYTTNNVYNDVSVKLYQINAL